MARAPGQYRIRVRGELGPEWGTWFNDLQVIPEPNGDTTLAGLVLDQAALHGLLARIRDLGLPLVSVQAVDDNGEPLPLPLPPDAPESARER